MTVRHLHHFNIRAPAAQLKPLRDFYVTILGLIDGERPPFRFAGHWLYAGAHPVVHLMEAKEGQPVPGEAGSIDHVAFACGDYAEMCRHLQQHGIAFRTSAVPGTAQRQVFLRDPLGNGIELNFTPDESSDSASQEMQTTKLQSALSPPN